MGFISLRSLWGLLIFFSVQGAQADAEQKYFYDENSIEKLQQPEFQKHKDSVFRLFYNGEGFGPTGSCTNTMISDEGHFITALHCIKYCIAKHEASATFYEFQMGPKTPKDAFVGVHLPTMMGKKCNVKDPITGKIFDVEFVISGPGTNLSGNAPIPGLVHLLDSGELGVQKAINFVFQGIAGNLDFAILKRTDQDKPQSCVPFTKEKSPSYLDNQNVWTLSYPAPSGWENENLANVETRLYSSGKVFPSYVDDPKLKEHADNIDFSDKAEEKRKYVFDLDSNKITDLPARLGSSGASLFDEKNEVAGVLSFTVDTRKKGEPPAPGATYFVDGPTIRNYIETDFQGVLNSEEIFGCSK